LNIWVTRAEPGASRTAERLRALGHEPVVAPVLETRALDVAIDLEGVSALAFTSGNGVRAFSGLSAARDLPVFAVGQATAQAAYDAGFADVVSADGDVTALARTIAAGMGARSGVVLWAGALEPAGDLVGALAARGVVARGQAVYETVALPVTVPQGVQAVLVHSPRAAMELARLPLVGLRVFCISSAAAAPLAGSDADAVTVAAMPDDTGLLALLRG
jgi:uroporphyrinogen-III synthase